MGAVNSAPLERRVGSIGWAQHWCKHGVRVNNSCQYGYNYNPKWYNHDWHRNYHRLVACIHSHPCERGIQSKHFGHWYWTTKVLLGWPDVGLYPTVVSDWDENISPWPVVVLVSVGLIEFSTNHLFFFRHYGGHVRRGRLVGGSAINGRVPMAFWFYSSFLLNTAAQYTINSREYYQRWCHYCRRLCSCHPHGHEQKWMSRNPDLCLHVVGFRKWRSRLLVDVLTLAVHHIDIIAKSNPTNLREGNKPRKIG